MRAILPAAPRLIGLLLAIALAGVVTGCAARNVRTKIINRYGIQVELVRQVKGFSTQPLGYEHPAIVSAERLTNILNSIEVETRDAGSGLIRQPAFDPSIVEMTAEGLAEAFGKATPDQEISVRSLRKQMQLGVFHRKYLTSFLAYIDDGHLYLLLKRVDWKVPIDKEGDDLPKPRRSYSPMNFRVVSGEHLFYAGPQTLEIDWTNPVFRTAYRLPGTTSGETRRREILEESPIPQDEQDATMGGGGVAIDELSAEQLRALADLEDDRREGRITEQAYQRAKRQLLRQR